MRNLIKIDKNSNVVYNSNIVDYINPDYIYVPVKKNYQLLVKGNETVIKGQVLMENNLNKVISPASGKILGIKKMIVDGKLTNTIVIANDFKEKSRSVSKKEFKPTKENIVSKLYEFHFNYIASILETKNINNLIVNGIDDEPYILNNEYVTNKYIKEILQITDIISSTFNIKNNIICIKSSNTRNIEHYLSRIGTYPNISLSLVEDKYLLGKDFFLLEYMNLKELDSLVISVSQLLEIYNAIVFNRYTEDTYITITGSEVEKSKVFKVKEGTLLQDVINKNIKIKENNDLRYVLNGLMCGYECNPENIIITKNTLGLLIINKIDYQEDKCNNCGLCYKICPVKVNPKRVMDTKEVSNSCIDCGLCSYICPCKINLRKFLRGEHE